MTCTTMSATAPTCSEHQKIATSTQQPTHGLRTTATGLFRPHECKRANRPWVDRVTGDVINTGCGSLQCPACLPWRALECARALAYVRPQHQLVLTGLATTRPVIIDQMNAFRRTLRRRLGFWEDAYHVESNPSGIGYHAHVWVPGTVALTYEEVALAAKRAGMGLVLEEITAAPITTESDLPLLKYGLKVPLEAPAVDADQVSDRIQHYLDINGGRLVSQTRGFWVDPDTGGRLGGRRQASTAALRQHYNTRFGALVETPAATAGPPAQEAA